MKPDMALLILAWQVACLFHEKEVEKLLPGATSATEAESAELDKIHDEMTPDVSWDELNEAYADFQNAKDRTDACILALKNEPPECKARVLEAMVRIAAASKENDNEDAISPEERNFIEEVQSRLAE
ncbi:hypothetical protein [Fibrobacter sp. UWP2]|jgi:hypothetical protein|uniref:hypothetical protein n=1 Tax=Fibrobacter sp. UWP2 TaxID=1896216 RepID=UPI00091DB66D|nr:hypothetical protein [Fibrobacter sp. UWP2]SHI30008.1 hypothetical protein SAMN05720471_10173 [Fibrobacter sp. UWP2]